MADTALTVPLRAVLERVHAHGPQTVPAIARSLYVTRQGVQALVDRGRDLGLVETVPNPAHRRSHLVVLTPAGNDLFDTVRADELARLDVVASGLDPVDVAAAVRVLDHLILSLEGLTHPQTPTTSTDPAERSTR
ncbi:MarR family winged helix-turn-helix transcriptional regulator [Ornithinimicrobium sp. F0845]|nr:MarR family winged helix-turn-helix transcriptional regulator [Ornithinimicrobium sp. F0845]